MLLLGCQRYAAASSAVPAPIGAMRSHGAKVLGHFTGADGLDTWVMHAGNKTRVFYVLPDGKHMLMGLVFNAKLNNLSAPDFARAAHEANDLAKPKDFSPVTTSSDSSASSTAVYGGALDTTSPNYIAQRSLREAYARMQRDASMEYVEGHGKNLYVVFDPACPYCHELYRETRAYVGKLRIHWLPVALISPSSPRLMQSFLRSNKRGLALADAVAGTLKAPNGPISNATRHVDQQAMIVLANADSAGVPLLLYSDNGTIKDVVGTPGAEQLNAIAALGKK